MNSIVKDYTNLSGLILYDKLTQNGLARNYFYTVTGSSNINIALNTLADPVITYDINKVNISGLSNYYDKTEIVSKLTDVVYDYAMPYAHKLCNRAVTGDVVNIFFKVLLAHLILI